MEEQAKVEYTVKDLLDKMSVKLDSIDLKLDTKADAAEVKVLQEHQRSTDARVEKLATWRQDHLTEAARWDKELKILTDNYIAQQALTHSRRWWIAVIVIPSVDLLINAFRYFK